MNLQEIDKLLEKYFDCDTSLAEERKLRQFFASGNLPPKYLELAEYFSYLGEEKDVLLKDPSFDARIQEHVDESRLARLFDLRRPWIYWTTGVAASLLILLAIFVRFDPLGGKINNAYEDPEVAYQQAKKVLLYVSAQMNKGTKDLQKIDKFDQGLQNVQPVASFTRGLDDINRLDEVDKVKNMISNN
jgi:hypothetical protein